METAYSVRTLSVSQLVSGLVDPSCVVLQELRISEVAQSYGTCELLVYIDLLTNQWELCSARPVPALLALVPSCPGHHPRRLVLHLLVLIRLRSEFRKTSSASCRKRLCAFLSKRTAARSTWIGTLDSML